MNAPWTRWLEAARIRLSSVRVRTALGAAAVVTVAVGVAGVGLVLTARHILSGNVDAAASQRAGQVAAAIASGDPSLLEQTLKPSAGDLTLVQVVNPQGHVVAASSVLANQPPMSEVRPAPGTTAWGQSHLLPDTEDPFRIVATTVATDDGSRTVLVAQSLRPVNEAIELITAATIVGMPMLALFVAVATFFFVGRSLRPVEAIRRRVAGITGRDLHARVPVPATRDEVAALADTMNGMLDRLQAASDAQRRFVADASHELRSPLATLQVGLEVLQPEMVTADDLDRLHAEAERLSRLVNDLLLLARADEHGLRKRVDDVDLDDVAYRCRDRLRSTHPDLKIDSDLQPVRIRGDAHEIERVIANLCDNAARHAGSAIALSVAREGDYATVTVDDDGPGIPPEQREKIFDRFVRLDGSRARDAGGTGLGLAIVREIVHGHGGTIRALAAPLGGARFQLRLPVEPAPSTEV